MRRWSSATARNCADIRWRWAAREPAAWWRRQVYEARKFGVHSAMPSTTALRKCPELIFVAPRFEVYRAVSRQIRSIFFEYTALVEPLSLDEAYLDVTANLRHLPSASDTAQQIRQRIFDWTGLTASAGISYNKFLAKLASDYKKPNGQYVRDARMDRLSWPRWQSANPRRRAVDRRENEQARHIHRRRSEAAKPRIPGQTFR